MAGLGRIVSATIAVIFLGVLVKADPASAARYSSMVVDADTGEVLYARNADQRRYPASLTKMMTLYMTFEALEKGRLRLDQPLKVSKRAAGQTPSRLGLKAGQTITVNQVILALVTKSANDAATVVAEALGGTEIEFAQAMTERANSLGMVRTRFTNATGLHNRRQRSTARDMSTLALALMSDFPQYYHYFSTATFTYRGRRYENHNGMLGTYRGTDGIKTGYVRASGFNLVASVERGDRRLIGVVFGGRSPRSRDVHLRQLLDQAFAAPPTRSAALIRRPGVKPTRRAPAPVQSSALPAAPAPAEPPALMPASARIPVVSATLPPPPPPPPIEVAAIEEGSARSAPSPAAAPHPARFTRTAQAATSFLRKRSAGEVGLSGDTRDPLAIANQGLRAAQQEQATGASTRFLDAVPRESSEDAKKRPQDLWAVQVGAYSRFSSAQEQVLRAAQAQPELLAGTAAVISAVENRGKTIYRAQLSGLTQTDARRVCKSLKRKDIGCLTVPAPPPNSIVAY